MALRYLRVGEGVGDNSYSVSEVAAYCQKPVPFPAQMRVASAPPTVVPKVYWDDIASARWELVLALLGLLFSVVGPMGVARRCHQAQGEGHRHPGLGHPFRAVPGHSARAWPSGRESTPCHPGGAGPGRVSDLLQLRFLPLSQFHPRLGHLSLLHRIEILARAELRSTVRVCGGGGFRVADAAPPGGDAQAHQPAHQYSRNHRRHFGASGTLQAAFYP